MSEDILTKKQKEGLSREYLYPFKHALFKEIGLIYGCDFAILTQEEILKMRPAKDWRKGGFSIGPRALSYVERDLKEYDLKLGMEKWKIQHFIKYSKNNYETNESYCYRKIRLLQLLKYSDWLKEEIAKLEDRKYKMAMNMMLKQDIYDLGL